MIEALFHLHGVTTQETVLFYGCGNSVHSMAILEAVGTLIKGEAVLYYVDSLHS
jgi:predicted membrane protein